MVFKWCEALASPQTNLLLMCCASSCWPSLMEWKWLQELIRPHLISHCLRIPLCARPRWPSAHDSPGFLFASHNKQSAAIGRLQPHCVTYCGVSVCKQSAGRIWANTVVYHNHRQHHFVCWGTLSLSPTGSSTSCLIIVVKLKCKGVERMSIASRHL